MSRNLLLRTGITNIQNISKKATTDIVVQGTTPSSVVIEKIPIKLSKPTSPVLLDGVVDFAITDSVAGTRIGNFSLDILRSVNGVSTQIYTQTFILGEINYTNPLLIFDHFKFHWLDKSPAPSICPDPCTNSNSQCSGTTITYIFQLSTPGLANNTQVAGIVAEDYYCLTVAEIPI